MNTVDELEVALACACTRARELETGDYDEWHEAVLDIGAIERTLRIFRKSSSNAADKARQAVARIA